MVSQAHLRLLHPIPPDPHPTTIEALGAIEQGVRHPCIVTRARSQTPPTGGLNLLTPTSMRAMRG